MDKKAQELVDEPFKKQETGREKLATLLTNN